MPRSPLFGRRVHITGSIPDDPAIASPADVDAARAFIQALVVDLVKKGATFVVPVDAEKTRPDSLPICFDWLVWETLAANLAYRPSGAPNPLAMAIQHQKSEDQIPPEKHELWDKLRGSDLIQIDNASHWNMASKRMEIQALHGDILITVGGSEGVLFLANLYHQSGKPVIPLNFKLCKETTGSLRLFSQALTSQQTPRFFKVESDVAPHAWMNRINFPARQTTPHRVSELTGLLEVLEKPTAFIVRLLNPKHEDYSKVENFFDGVVKPLVEQEFGYLLKVVDGNQPYEHPRVDSEIFNKLHRAAVVIADLTGLRPNCFLELGYALGRSVPTMVTAADGTKVPFDVETVPTHFWIADNLPDAKRDAFRKYWRANIKRPPLVTPEPLIP